MRPCGRRNIDVGAKVLEKNGVEFFIRGVGFIKTVEDIEKVVIRQESGTPIQVRNVATVHDRARTSAAARWTRRASKPWAAWRSCATAKTRCTSSSG